MNKGKEIALVMLLLVATSCVKEEQNTINTSSIVSAPDGKSLYLQKCQACHGKDGKLGVAGAKLLPDSKLNKLEIQSQIKNGKGLMPAFASQLSENEIEAIAEYVISLKSGSCCKR